MMQERKNQFVDANIILKLGMPTKREHSMQNKVCGRVRMELMKYFKVGLVYDIQY
jgi:hypothetical protein